MLTFMGVSAFILDTLHTVGGHVFWLVFPFRRTEINNNDLNEKPHQTCLHHDQSCESYVLQALKNYGSIGLCLELLRAIFHNSKLIWKSPIAGMVQSVKRINPKFLLFVAGYPTFYRVSDSLTVKVLID